MTKDFDYTALVDRAMRRVVYDVLRQVAVDGLADPHHFFITFRTEHPGVVMSDMLRSKYPQEITIVLQHQFRDLKVEQDYFRVTLSFSNIPEKLTVPFDALTGFADPSVKFGLQFHANDEEDILVPVKPLASQAIDKTVLTEGSDSASQEGAAKVFTLDAFRKK